MKEITKLEKTSLSDFTLCGAELLPKLLKQLEKRERQRFSYLFEPLKRHGGFMIIDFHTHTFPNELAERAVGALAKSAKICNYLDGTTMDLRRSMKNANIDFSVLLPVATKPEQQGSINEIALEINRHSDETGLLSFGGIHPDNDNYRHILRSLARNGVKGIKLHPVFQQTYIDDLRYLRIISYACECELIVLIHSGYDISHPYLEFSSVPHVASMLDTLHPQKIVLAHMGGWNCWEETEKYLIGKEVWLDTSFSLLPIRSAPDMTQEKSESYRLSPESFLRMVREHGANRVLFGSDSPWGGQAETLAALKETGLTDEEQKAVLGENAAKLLQLPF